MARDRSFAARPATIGVGVVAVCGLLVWLFVWWNRPPQMGADEEVFKTVDALFTAVTARDEKLLGQCEQRLQAYRDAGRLPAEASSFLDGVIRKAKAGGWESAAEKLYDFMKAQRREGASEPSPKKQKDSRPRK